MSGVSKGREERLDFTLSLEPKKVHLKRLVPVVTGSREDAMPIVQFFGLDWSMASADAFGRAVMVTSGQIDFVDEGAAIFRLKV